MHKLFLILSIAGLVYFLYKKRETDLFTLAYFSATIYFLPGYLGYVTYPGKINVSIDEQVYVVFILVQLSIWSAAFIKDHIPYKSIRKKTLILKEAKYTSHFLAIIATSLTIYYIIFLNKNLLEPKNVMMPMLGSLFILLRYSAAFAFIMGFIEKNRWILIMSGFVLGFTFLIGFRGPVALTAMAIILIYLKSKGSKSLLRSQFKIIIGILCIAYFMIMGKVFYGTFKTEGIFNAFSVLFNLDYISNAFSSIESFGIQTILNEVIVQKFNIGISHLSGLIYQLLVIPSLFIDESYSFNYLFQSHLFPDVEYGMAYNIWAEALSAGGYIFLVVVILIFIIGIVVLDNLSASKNTIVRSFAALSGIYWTFFIHRYSIAAEMTHQRHIIYILILGVLLSLIYTIFIEVVKKHKGVPHGT